VVRGMAVVALPGFLAGSGIVWSSSHRPSMEWAIWAVIAVALTTASGTMASYGMRRWTDLTSIVPVPLRAVGRTVGLLYLLVVVLGAAYTGLSIEVFGRVSWNASLLIAIALVGALPTVCVAAGIAQAAQTVGAKPAAVQVAALVRLRRLLGSLLAAFSGIVALLVLAQVSAAHVTRDLPPQVTLLFGGVSSVFVAVVYLPAASALRTQGSRLVEVCEPVGPETGAALVTQAERRAKLEALLGVDRTSFSDLQTNLAVLGPLAASALAAFLPG
jgi:hypothetical protein